MRIFKFRKNLGNLLCKNGFHDFKMIEILNSYNSHIKDHENLRLVGGYLDMPIDFEHKKCKRCGFEVNEIKDSNVVANK